MTTQRNRIGLALVLAIVVLSVAAGAQPETESSAIRLLIVDETKTFLSTMRVGALVGVLKGAGLFEVDVKFADVATSWDDPLDGETLDPGLEPYDIVVVIPVGIDDGTVDWVLLVSGPPPLLDPAVLAGLGAVGQITSQVFEGNVRAVGITDHLLVALLYGIYSAEGWMR